MVKTVSSYLDCRTFQTSFQSATSKWRVMRAGVALCELVSPVLFSRYVNDIHTPSRHFELVHYACDTALTAMSRSSSLLVAYLETYLGRLELWFRDWRIATDALKSMAVLFAKTARRVRKPRPMLFLGEPTKWVERPRYLGETLDIRIAWSAHINEMRKKAPQRLGVPGPLLNTRSGLSVRNAELLYKQLISPTMDYSCPIWRSAARSHVQKLQVLHSECLRIATNAPWYFGYRQSHEDLAIPFFADHIRALTASFDSS
jgi:hypothetical protein